MNLRRKVIWSYLRHFDIVDVIPHHWSIHISTLLLYSSIVWALLLAYYFLSDLIVHDTMRIMWTVVWVVVYAFFFVDLCDKYLDALVVTKSGLVHFNWEHIFKHKTSSFQRLSIEKISEEKTSFWDTLLNRGDLRITLEDRTYFFEKIGSPAAQVGKILRYRQQSTQWGPQAENHMPHSGSSVSTLSWWSGGSGSSDTHDVNNEILMEALSEVIMDYIDKKKPG